MLFNLIHENAENHYVWRVISICSYFYNSCLKDGTDAAWRGGVGITSGQSNLVRA